MNAHDETIKSATSYLALRAAVRSGSPSPFLRPHFLLSTVYLDCDKNALEKKMTGDSMHNWSYVLGAAEDYMDAEPQARVSKQLPLSVFHPHVANHRLCFLFPARC